MGNQSVQNQSVIDRPITIPGWKTIMYLAHERAFHTDIRPNRKRSPHQSKRASKHISATR